MFNYMPCPVIWVTSLRLSAINLEVFIRCKHILGMITLWKVATWKNEEEMVRL
jgi:hypothetical protein